MVSFLTQDFYMKCRHHRKKYGRNPALSKALTFGHEDTGYNCGSPEISLDESGFEVDDVDCN